MAITRRERRELDHVGSRQLRSGKHLPTLLATALSVRRPGRSRKTCQPRSLVFAQPDLVAEEAAPEQSQRYEEDQSDHAAPMPSSANNSIRPQPLSMEIDESEESLARNEILACFRDPSQQGFFSASEAEDVPAEIDHAADHDPQMLSASEGSVSGSTTGVRDAEDTGLPTDNKWDLVAAHERRFCFDHGEDEWLLEYAERWMYPSDFGVIGAEEAMKSRLQKYHSAVLNSKPHKQASRAECNHSLWSQVETPVQQADVKDKVIYLVRWKLCWTAQSSIDDLNWVQASYNARNRVTQRRRSDRVEETAEARMAKREKMMVVVNLEDLL